jgi:GR25 family glycosyltransferase involved in LPS biosynthesis
MINLNEYFEKIYCINLERRLDRYESVLNEFNKFNIQGVEIYSAIDGNTIINNSSLLNGELGILETHYNIIKSCKEHGVKNVLILEDDIYFTEEINKLNDYMQSVPKDWDLLYFGGNHIYGNPPTKINDKILKLNFTVALHCVAINESIYDAILAVLPLRKKQVDTYYAQLQSGYNGYSFYPNMAKQKADYSDIQNKFVDYTNYFLN